MDGSGMPAGWFDRWRARWAERSAERVFERLSADPDATRPGVVRAAAICLSALILVVVAVLLVGLVRWTLHASGPQWVGVILCWLVALVVRPRRRPLPADVIVLAPADYPGVHRYVAETARRVGVRPPRLIGVDLRLNAWVSAVGWRRRSALVLGLPLTCLGSRHVQLGVLAHELGHLRGRDTAAARIIDGAGSLLEGVRYLLSPTQAAYVSGSAEGMFGQPIAAAQARVAQTAANLLVALVVLPVVVLDVALELLELASRQREEFLADRRAAHLAGSAAMTAGLCWDLVGIHVATAAAARRGEDPYAALLARTDPSPAQVTARAAQTVLPGHRTDTTHPPDALRIRLVEQHPCPASPDFPDEELAAAADAELAQLRSQTRATYSEALRFGPAS